MSLGIQLAERGLVPDVVIRAAIARLDRARLLQEAEGGPGARDERLDTLVRSMAGSPVAVATDAANAQHYEVPVDFFRAALGPRLKYSCCLFPLRPSSPSPTAHPSAGSSRGCSASGGWPTSGSSPPT